MNDKEIATVVTIHKCKSFYEASLLLHYSTSTISKYVSSIEKKIGVKLFIRSNKANSISLTEEGEALIPGFIEIHSRIQNLKNTIASMQSSIYRPLRLGVIFHFSALGIEQIIANFYQLHQNVIIEQTKHSFEHLINELYSKSFDGVFVVANSGSSNFVALNEVLKDPKVESILVSRETEFYLGVSRNYPVSEMTEAPISAFRDFTFLFHHGQETMINSGMMSNLSRMSEKAGFSLKPLFLDPHELGAFYLATQMKAAIPAIRPPFEYPGIVYVKVSDWDTYSLVYFFSLASNRNQMLSQFKNTIATTTAHHS